MTERGRQVDDWGADEIFSAAPPIAETPPAETPDVRPAPDFRRRRRTAVGFGAAGLAGAVLLIAALKEDGVSSVPESDAPVSQLCAPPSAQDLQAVQRLFTQPPRQDESGLPDNAGVHTHQLPRLFRYGKDSAVWKQASLGEVLASANSMTRRYGFKIRLGRDSDNYSHGFSPLRAGEADEAAKDTIDTVLLGLQDMPVEYVRYSGVKRLILSRSYGRGNTAAYASSSPKKHIGSMFFTVDTEQDVRSFAHEDEHLVDMKQCGNDAIETDPSFQALNGGRRIYNKKARLRLKPRVFSLESVYMGEYPELNRLRIDTQDAMMADDKEYCRLKPLLDEQEKSAVVVTDYSFKNAAEDKAEIAEHLGQPASIYELLDPAHPVIRRKFEFIMARLYAVLPNVVRYYANHSRRPNTHNVNLACNPRNYATKQSG